MNDEELEKRIEEALQKVTESTAKILERQGLNVRGSTPEETRANIRNRRTRWPGKLKLNS